MTADEALAELRAMRCDDPAAARANDAVRLTVYTLETFWLPALETVGQRESGG